VKRYAAVAALASVVICGCGSGGAKTSTAPPPPTFTAAQSACAQSFHQIITGADAEGEYTPYWVKDFTSTTPEGSSVGHYVDLTAGANGQCSLALLIAGYFSVIAWTNGDTAFDGSSAAPTASQPEGSLSNVNVYVEAPGVLVPYNENTLEKGS
jgi:hypothetical protein